MTRENMNSIKIIVETKKSFMINEENISFAIIDFENNEYLNINLNNSLNKVVNNKRKRFKKANIAMLSLSLIFIKLTCNAELLLNFITLK